MAAVVKRVPMHYDPRAAAAACFCPSISIDTMFQAPCRLSRSCPMTTLRLLERHEIINPSPVRSDPCAEVFPRCTSSCEQAYAARGEGMTAARRAACSRVILAAGTSVPGSRRRLRSVTARAPFNHVQDRVPESGACEDQLRQRRQGELHALRTTLRLVVKNRFFTSCCVMVEPPRPRCGRLPGPDLPPSAPPASRCRGAGRSGHPRRR